jgi:hypothetical protein
MNHVRLAVKTGGQIMQVTLREVSWSDLWIWFEFEEAPTEKQRLYLEQVLDAWYSLGLLGGFNASRLLLNDTDEMEISYSSYNLEDTNPMPSLIHNMGTTEFEGSTAKCWFDLGTADALSLDVLINALDTLSSEYMPIVRLTIGGSEDSPPWFMEDDD